MEKELISIADPMCSWCWGFSPVIERVADLIRTRAKLRVVPGGLRTDTRLPLSEHEVGIIMDEWRKIAAQTGQPFDFDQPLTTDYVYNTGPACRAVALITRERPACGLDYLRSLQQAFYVGRRDLKDPEVLADYAQSFGVRRDAFHEQFARSSVDDALDQDLHFVQQCGVQGFPAVLLRTGPRIQKLTIGYQPYEVLAPHLQRWLEALE
ncbi:MAG: DsbA family protein [Panacagrimonas sp.]